MHAWSHQVVFLIYTTFVSGVLAVCPYQDCVCSGNRISCANLRLDKVPVLTRDDINETYTDVDFYRNQITDIPANSLPPNLTSISFRQNPIATISDDAFADSANTLEKIYFEDAKFKKFPAGFYNFTSLKTLSMVRTYPDGWDRNLLSHLGITIRTLILLDVGLQSWPNWMQLFPLLETLHMSNDPLTDIPDDAFSLVKDTLKDLTLNYAKLSRVPKALSELTALKSLTLQFDDIIYLEGLPMFSPLKSINLHINRIKNVYRFVYDLLPYTDSLTTIELHSNQLGVIPRLAHMTKLNKVDLSVQMISDATSGSFSPSVSTLNLHYNFLDRIPDVVYRMSGLVNLDLSTNRITDLNFTTMPPKLFDLNIARNKITSLHDDSFPNRSYIGNLNLDGNPVTSISLSAFSNLPFLLNLDLRNTKLKRVPVALSALTNLNTLTMYNLSDLICTCEESQLADWVKLRTSMVISGNCGDIKIEMFFRNLAPQCPKS